MLTCQKRITKVVKYVQLYFSIPRLLMHFVSMDFIGSLTPLVSGHWYALREIWLLTGYTFCVFSKTKRLSEELQAHVDEVYAKFEGSSKILSHKGTEFKNQLFTYILTQQGVDCKTYSPPYHLHSNERIEWFHNFLKACMSKHVSRYLQTDQVVPLACAA